MKYLPLLIFCALTLCTLVLSHRFPIPASVTVYLWVLLSTNLFALCGLQSDVVSSSAYVKVLYFLVAISAVSATCAMVDLASILPRGPFFALTFCAATCVAMITLIVVFYIQNAYKGQLYRETEVVLAEAAVYTTLGIVILTSLAAPLSNLNIALRLSLGSYMLLRGIVAYGFASGVVRHRALWLSLNSWLPMLPGILCLGLLLVWLCFGQADLVHQETPSAAIQQGHVVAMEVSE